MLYIHVNVIIHNYVMMWKCVITCLCPKAYIQYVARSKVYACVVVLSILLVLV